MIKGSSYLPLQLGDLFTYGLKTWRKQRLETGTSYTITAADNGMSLVFNNAALVTVTIPDSLALTALEVEFEIVADGAAGVSIVVSGSATTNGATSALTVDQYKGATVRMYSTDNFKVYGV